MNMRKLISTLLLLGFATTASAVPMNFSYQFNDGTVLSGSIDGTIQADTDTVFINSFGPVTLGGVLLDAIDNTEFVSVSDFDAGALQPLFSFSGNMIDVIACPMGFTSTNNCSFTDDSGFYLHNGVNPFFAFSDAGAANIGGPFSIDDNFNVDNWSLTVEPVAVPEPATLVLFLMGALGIFGARFKSQHA